MERVKRFVALRRRGGILIASVFLIFGISGEAISQGTENAPGPRVGGVIEGIAAVVGDKLILRSEVDEQFASLAPQFQIDPADTTQANQLRREILDNLISEQLLDIQAQKEGLKIDESQIQQAVDSAIQGDRERLGAEGFAKELEKEGITEAQLRARYSDQARSELLRRQLLQKEVFSKVHVTDAEVQKSFLDNKEKIGKKPRALRVLDLYVRVTPDSTIEATYRKRAEKIWQEIKGGLSIDQAAKKYSDDEKSRDNGGLLPRFGPGDLGDRSFEKIAFSLPVGEVGAPIRTNLGYHIIQAVARDPDGQWTQIRHVLIKVTPSRTDETRAQEKIDSIRAQIVGGKLDFADAVRRYSDDAESRETGGDVGWLPIDNFLGETRGVVDSLRVGEVSRRASVEGGFHLFKLIGDQAETDYTFDEIKDQLREMVERDARQKQLEGYLAELKTHTSVEIRSLK